MPLYDYRCTDCGREVEVMHGIHDSGPEKCQHCSGAMRKALSPPAIHFKGRGWAKKDAAAATAKKAKPKGSATSEDSKKGDATATSSDGAKADTATKSSPSTDSKGTASATAGSKTD